MNENELPNFYSKDNPYTRSAMAHNDRLHHIDQTAQASPIPRLKDHYATRHPYEKRFNVEQRANPPGGHPFKLSGFGALRLPPGSKFLPTSEQVVNGNLEAAGMPLVESEEYQP